MLVTEIQLRKIIREAVVENAANELEDDLEQVFDQAEDAGESILKSVLANIETMADQAEKDPEAFKEKVEESLQLTQRRLDEAVGWIAVGTAAAMPVLLKGVSKLVKVIAKGLSKIDSYEGSDEFWEETGDRWEDWWKKKSKDLHHAYIGAIELIVGGVAKLMRKKLDDKQKHKIAEGIWTLIVAFLMYKSGAGVLHQVGHHAYGVAGLETVLASIKAGEVSEYVAGLFAIVAKGV